MGPVNVKKLYICSAIGLMIMFGFGYLPNIGPLSDMGMKCFGVLLGLIWLWSTVDLGWPAFMSFVALSVTGCLSVNEILTTAFSNYTVLFLIFSCMIVIPLGESGMFDYVANWMLKQSFLQGHPWRITIAVFVLCYIGLLLQGGFAVLMMLYALTFKISDTVGMPYTSPWVAAMLMGITLVNICGGCAMPFLAGPMYVLSLFIGAEFVNISFISFILFATLLTATITCFYLIVMRFVLCVDVSLLANMDIATCAKPLPPMSKYQKTCAVLLIAYMTCVILIGSTNMLPASAFTAVLQKIGLIGNAWIFICIMLLYRVDGKPIATLSTMGQKCLWDAAMICAAGMVLGGYMLRPELGISALLSDLTISIFAGHSAFVFTFLVITVALLLANVLNNAVVVMLMAQIVFIHAGSIVGLNMVVLAVFMIFAVNIVFLLPGASVMGAIVHSNAPKTGKKNLYLWAVMTIVCTILAFLALIPVANMMF